MIDEAAARALVELLPGIRRRRLLLWAMNHPELEEEDFVGTVNWAIKTLGAVGAVHITRNRSWDLDLETT